MFIHDYSWYQRHGHICGLYYNVPLHGYLQKTYLPQVELQAHATILASTSRTVLTQVFINPSTEKGVREVRYTFPLYDGVSVVGFTCHVGDREIIGEVKEKEKARAVFKDAVSRGRTAGLFEQLPEASDVFTTTVGNIPPGAKVVINITYLGELKHDMEVDGIRFTIPNIICPRYGNVTESLRSTSAVHDTGIGISIIVDVDMADGSFIQKIQSPSHPISMTIGTTSLAPDAEPKMTKASATLALNTAELGKDFVLQVIAKNTSVPKAVLENHPTIPDHRALMATLVPKFALPPEKPELVFVCDRSGSMAGSRITLVIQALKVFLKSLPIGVKFNICSFGSSYSFLWNKSVTYSQRTLDEAIRHAETFQANYGGTEMLTPLKATIDQRYKDMPLDVMVLTDGETWNQQALFSYLNDSVTESKAPVRLFTLGIGNGVSHALIEGIAKAGNGFSQAVGEGEGMDTKVVRMLKGALSPHVNDYTLEVKYANTTLDNEDEEFEIVEKVTDSLKVKLTLSENELKPATVSFELDNTSAILTGHEQKSPISLFDTSADPDKEDSPGYDDSGEQRYAHLPTITAPKIIQAPQNIPSLFAFNRTTVYLLLGPEAPKATPKSVLLRGTSAHGPLELEIPIHVLDQPSETIHQLAAKKAISELEQGRGWLSEAKDDTGVVLKTKFEGRFEDMVEREAVRLGVQFQVGGKWCSFVAVESNKRSKHKEGNESEDWEYLDDARHNSKTSKSSWPSDTPGGKAFRTSNGTNTTAPDSIAQQPQAQQAMMNPMIQQQRQAQQHQQMFAMGPSRGRGGGIPPQSMGSGRGGGRGGAPPSMSAFTGLTQEASGFVPSSPQSPGSSNSVSLQDYQMELMLLEQAGRNRLTMVRSNAFPAPAPSGAHLFGSSPAPTGAQSFGSPSTPTGAQLFGSSPAPTGAQLFGSSSTTTSAQLFGSSPAPAGTARPIQLHEPSGDDVGFDQQGVLENFDFDSFLDKRNQDEDVRAGSSKKKKKKQRHEPSSLFGVPAVPSAAPTSAMFGSSVPSQASYVTKTTPDDLTHHLIALQTFEGYWELSMSLLKCLQIKEEVLQLASIEAGVDSKVFVTAVVVAVFEQKLNAFEGSWELVVDKAKAWLGEQGVDDVDGFVGKAKILVK
jgi:hypothetical protein